MKPRNFPGRKLRRWVRAWERLHPGCLHNVKLPPSDIRIRLGKARRVEFYST